MAGNMKLLDQVYQQEHHQAKTLSLKALQHPQVILRHAGYPAFPCLRIPHTIARESSQDQSNSPERGLGAHGACSTWESHRQQGHSSLSRTHRQQSQALASPGCGTEPARDRHGAGSATAGQGGTICQPGQTSSNQVECQQGSQERGSYQMKSQERLQGSVVQLEELKWKRRMPK